MRFLNMPSSLTPNQTIARLAGKGMMFSDPADAEQFFQKNNYNRFRAYCVPFLNPNDVCSINGERFSKPISFSNIQFLYQTDAVLRQSIFIAIQDIEICLRSQIALVLGRHGEFAHYDVRNLCDRDKKHAEWVHRLNQQIKRSKISKPKNRQLNLWKTLEIIDFGSLSTLFRMLKSDDAKEIAKFFGYPSLSIFKGHLHHINSIRNKSAHHEKLADRDYTNGGTHNIKIPNQWKYQQGSDVGCLYNIILILCYISNNINIHHWKHFFVNFASNCCTTSEQKNMLSECYGFPVNWELQDIWKRYLADINTA